MRSAPKSLWAKVALFASSLIVTLLVFELAFRIFDIRAVYFRPRVLQALPSPTESVTPATVGMMPFATIRLIYASDPRGYFGPSNTIDLVHNSEGFRDVGHSVRKPPQTYRILGLGDSYLWGEGVKREDICLTKLGSLLGDASSGMAIETINMGMSQFNTLDERGVLKYAGLKYDPDLVIVHFVLNDVVVNWHKGPKVEFFKDYRAIYESPDTLSRYSQLWSWARQRFLREIRGRHYIQQCISSFSSESDDWRLCRDALKDIQNICADRQIGLLVVIFPFFHELDGNYPFQPIHDVVHTYCVDQGIDVLDLRDDFRQFNGPELWVHPTDQHPNEIAHDITARAVAKYLINQSKLFAPGGESKDL